MAVSVVCRSFVSPYVGTYIYIYLRNRWLGCTHFPSSELYFDNIRMRISVKVGRYMCMLAKRRGAYPISYKRAVRQARSNYRAEPLAGVPNGTISVRAIKYRS